MQRIIVLTSCLDGFIIVENAEVVNARRFHGGRPGAGVLFGGRPTNGRGFAVFDAQDLKGVVF